MLSIVVCAVLTVVPLQEQEALDPARVEAAVTELRAAFDKGGSEDQIRAIRRNALADPDIVSQIARGLRSSDAQVRNTVVETLRYLPHPAARKGLESYYRRNGRRMRKDDLEAYASLIKAIGQHGSPHSIDILVDDIWEVRDNAVVQARIYSLGRVRDEEAVKKLFGLMKSGGRNRIQPFMDELRLSLMVLTGADQGKSQDRWLAWWNDNKRTLEVSPDQPLLPKYDAQRWYRYWGGARMDERPRKRGDRGR